MCQSIGMGNHIVLNITFIAVLSMAGRGRNSGLSEEAIHQLIFDDSDESFDGGSESDEDYVMSDTSSSSGEEASEFPSPRKRSQVLQHTSITHKPSFPAWLSPSHREQRIGGHGRAYSAIPVQPAPQCGRSRGRRARGSKSVSQGGPSRAQGRPPRGIFLMRLLKNFLLDFIKLDGIGMVKSSAIQHIQEY